MTSDSESVHKASDWRRANFVFAKPARAEYSVPRLAGKHPRTRPSIRTKQSKATSAPTHAHNTPRTAHPFVPQSIPRPDVTDPRRLRARGPQASGSASLRKIIGAPTKISEDVRA
ncbi:hypothetical protein FA95DRAFT_1564648 [Auriscalpium vulgare]|uniref:Uncharacterized protein n=1 Tax=Auriscalpium vulgare TaxID=40419 RepID=A0ACB8REL8_9AGAM|nr:hypothetical protein FA95DRAFT_1564648 [Auriscalpium vulgare]